MTFEEAQKLRLDLTFLGTKELAEERASQFREIGREVVAVFEHRFRGITEAGVLWAAANTLHVVAWKRGGKIL